jgi:integrase
MLTVLSTALTTAMKRGLVARNVAQLIDRPAIEHREMSTWTPQQVERFREHVRSDRLYACWLLTLAGWRRSKVLGLAWSAVDFDAGTSASPRAALSCAVRAPRPAHRNPNAPGGHCRCPPTSWPRCER